MCPKYQFLKTFVLGIPCYSTTLTTRGLKHNVEYWNPCTNVTNLWTKLEQIWHDHQVFQLKWKISRFPDWVATRPAIGYLHWLVFRNQKKKRIYIYLHTYIYIYICIQGLIGLEMFFDFRFYLLYLLFWICIYLCGICTERKPFSSFRRFKHANRGKRRSVIVWWAKFLWWWRWCWW